MSNLFHAHVQHPKGSGYMMQTGSFRTAEDAVREYLRLIDTDPNPFGRRALERNPEPIMVLLIPAELRGPDAMAYTGFCSVWTEDGRDAFDVPQPDYTPVRNPRYKG